MSPRVRLIILSFLMLFVELVLIRWLGSNIVFLSYFTNFVLLGSFLGIGVGFLRSSRELDLSRYAPVALAVFVALVWFFLTRGHYVPNAKPEYFLSPGNTGLPVWAALPLVFAAVATVMALIGEGVARSFKRFEPLEAYRLDILGSLLGVVCFSVLSFLSASPIMWGAVVGMLFLVLELPRPKWHQLGGIAALLVVLGMQSFGNQLWSPYYRIQVFAEGPDVMRVYANGRPHQFITANVLDQRFANFAVPFVTRADSTPPQEVLVIGAGTGSDVQAALAYGVGHIDAVEIDPGIYDLAVRANPGRPYDDPRVSAFVTDGRAFLEGTDKEYDVIVFAMPDSFTLIAGSGGVRLESYLLTQEAVDIARDHLKPGGTFVLSEYFREGYALDRTRATMTGSFGTPPCEIQMGSDWGAVLLVASTDPAAIRCPQTAMREPVADVLAPVTDDRPFPFVEGRSIPTFYLVALAGLFLISFGAVRITSGPLRQMRPYTDLFFMGAAFLLLETKNVVQFSLLFGSTWFVNALVFGGILVTVLAAIEVAKRVSLDRPGRIYLALFAALFVAWAFPSSWLLAMPYPLRVLAGITIAFTPVFLANLVFARRFRDVGSSTVAFGANLLGAMVGGMLEYGSLMIGYRGLTIVAAALYAAAWAFGSRHLTEGHTESRIGDGEVASAPS